MKTKKEKDLNLMYLYKKLLRLEKKFNDFERLVYTWKQKDDEIIQKLKNKLTGEGE